MKVSITQDDGKVYELTATLLSQPSSKRYVLLNCINWGSLGNLPPATEYTYFVLLVKPDGKLYGGNDAQERKFIADVKAKGGKVTFSIGGGTQSVLDIVTAVINRGALITEIASRMALYGYDGVTLDIENTNIPSTNINSFIGELRARLGPTAIIGLNVQPYQINTVWGQIQAVQSAITWLAPMLYDAGTYNRQKWITDTNAWVTKVGKEKLLCGLAVNYPAPDGGLNPTHLGEMLDVINTEGWKGVGLWNDALHTAPYQDVLKSKFT